MPKVSVIMPSYNTAGLIAEALDSVFAQDYRDFEVIIINDGSPDTPELERVLTPYRDRIVYLKQENRRACGARNNGIRSAKGEYVALLDSDDSWEPAFLRKQMEMFERDPSLDMVYCDCVIYGGGPQTGKTFMQTCPSDGEADFEAILTERCQAPISGTIVRRKTMMDAGLFDERLAMCDDYEMWLRLAYRGARIGYHREKLAKLRIGRPNSLSASDAKMQAALVTILSNVKAEWKLTAEQQALLAQKLEQAQALLALEQGKEFLKRREFDKARLHLEQANGQLRRGKLSLTLLGLRIAPGLMALAARKWERLRLRFAS
ncbi:MAG TPA: glycosyltransferase [Terriglobales bacterium]|nr:glycosyltransferase [Terriglobales bacterium]